MIRILHARKAESRALAGCLLALLGSTFSRAGAAEPSVRDAFHAGVQAFAASNYPAAMASFLDAAGRARPDGFDPAVAHFNAALAAHAAGQLDQATTHFANATASPSLDLQARAYYNRGRTLLQLARQSPPPSPSSKSSSGSSDSSALLHEAIRMFENAIALDPDDMDAKANYELAVRMQQEPPPKQQKQESQEPQEDSEDQEPQPQPDSSPSPQPSDGSPPQPDPGDSSDGSQSDADDSTESGSAQDPAPSPDEMSREDAEMLLDALKAQEQSQRDRLHPFFGPPVPVEKDW